MIGNTRIDCRLISLSSKWASVFAVPATSEKAPGMGCGSNGSRTSNLKRNHTPAVEKSKDNLAGLLPFVANRGYYTRFWGKSQQKRAPVRNPPIGRSPYPDGPGGRLISNGVNGICIDTEDLLNDYWWWINDYCGGKGRFTGKLRPKCHCTLERILLRNCGKCDFLINIRAAGNAGRVVNSRLVFGR